MSKLEMMRKMKMEQSIPPHPLKGEDVLVRFPYLVGVAIVASEDEGMTPEKSRLVSSIGISLGLAEDQIEKGIKGAAEAEQENIQNILAVLEKKEHQKAFLLDLYAAAWRNGKFGDNSCEMAELFAAMLNVDASEQRRLQDYAQKALSEKATEFSLQEIGLARFGEEIFIKNRTKPQEKNQVPATQSINKSETERVKRLRELAESGDAPSQNQLAICYFAGKGITKNSAEAIKWFRKAASQGYSNAENKLGECYRDGTGVTKNRAEAIKWFRKAAKKGNIKAKANIKKLTRIQ